MAKKFRLYDIYEERERIAECDNEVGIVEQAKRMSIGRSHFDMVVNGPVVLLSNGKEAVADYEAAFKGCWQHHGFWIAAIFEDGHEVEA